MKSLIILTSLTSLVHVCGLAVASGAEKKKEIHRSIAAFGDEMCAGSSTWCVERLEAVHGGGTPFDLHRSCGITESNLVESHAVRGSETRRVYPLENSGNGDKKLPGTIGDNVLNVEGIVDGQTSFPPDGRLINYKVWRSGGNSGHFLLLSLHVAPNGKTEVLAASDSPAARKIVQYLDENCPPSLPALVWPAAAN